MSKNAEIVRKLYEACSAKDLETVRKLIQPNYSLKDPMMELHSADEFIEMIQSCPGGGFEDLMLISEGDKVVGIFTGVMEQPAPSRMRMCSVITMENGKVRSEEMIYDTAQISHEMMDVMKKSITGQNKNQKGNRASVN